MPPFATAKRSIDHATEPPSFYDAIVPKNLEAVWGKLGERNLEKKRRRFYILYHIGDDVIHDHIWFKFSGRPSRIRFSKFITQLSVQVSRNKGCIMKFVRRTMRVGTSDSPDPYTGRMFNGLSRALDKSLERVFPNSPRLSLLKTSLLGTLVLTFFCLCC